MTRRSRSPPPSVLVLLYHSEPTAIWDKCARDDRSLLPKSISLAHAFLPVRSRSRAFAFAPSLSTPRALGRSWCARSRSLMVQNACPAESVAASRVCCSCLMTSREVARSTLAFSSSTWRRSFPEDSSTCCTSERCSAALSQNGHGRIRHRETAQRLL